uniref:Uncharacterized protein n=1 Tax=Poecilia latipinna TaxID=48699 RepID=A0A3B3VTX5_9TELE
MTGDTDKYLAPHDLRELGDDSLPQEGYMGFSVGMQSAYNIKNVCCHADALWFFVLTGRTTVSQKLSLKFTFL